MRRNWILIGFTLLVAVLAIAAVACDGDDDDGDGDDGGAATLAATLLEMDGSGATGSVTLTEADDGTTEVVVTMEGLSEGPHANHIHHGTCDEQGEIHVTLEELQADADGNATATTTDFAEEDPDPEFSHFEAGHYVAVHTEGNETIGAVISCGVVE